MGDGHAMGERSVGGRDGFGGNDMSAILLALCEQVRLIAYLLNYILGLWAAVETLFGGPGAAWSSLASWAASLFT